MKPCSRLVGNMRGLDTNVLVRYLVTDDHKRTALAERLVEHSRGLGDPLYISIVVLCERRGVHLVALTPAPVHLLDAPDHEHIEKRARQHDAGS